MNPLHYPALSQVLAAFKPWTVEQVWKSVPWQDSYHDLYPGYSKPADDEHFESYYPDEAAAREDALDMIARFTDLPDPIPIFRVIHAKSEKDIKLDRLGNHWAWVKKSALSFASHNISGKPWFLLTAEIPKAKVDWPTTLRKQFHFPEENEINLASWNQPKLLEIEKLK